MAVQTIEILKEKFKSGSFPTQQDYHDVFDSFLSKGESLTTDNIKGTGDSSGLSLTQILASLDIPTVPEGLDDFIAKVNSFLDDTDATDETINKWKEIESFLSGITDTQTLTGLLADLKAEILAETNNVSNKKFCEIIDDLDASDAEVGTIAIYGGQSNEKYTHGFIYEKHKGGKRVIIKDKQLVNNNGGVSLFEIDDILITTGVEKTITSQYAPSYQAIEWRNTRNGVTFLSGSSYSTEGRLNISEYSSDVDNPERIMYLSVDSLSDAPDGWQPLNVMNVIN